MTAAFMDHFLLCVEILLSKQLTARDEEYEPVLDFKGSSCKKSSWGFLSVKSYV